MDELLMPCVVYGRIYEDCIKCLWIFVVLPSIPYFCFLI